MNKFLKLIILISIFAFATNFASNEYVQLVFYGKVFIDDSIASIGTEVQVAKKNYNSTYTIIGDKNTVNNMGYFTAVAKGDNPMTETVEEGFALYDTIHFMVNGRISEISCPGSVYGGCNIFRNGTPPYVPPSLREIEIHSYYLPRMNLNGSVIFNGTLKDSVDLEIIGLEYNFRSRFTIYNGKMNIVIRGDIPETDLIDGYKEGEVLTFFLGKFNGSLNYVETSGDVPIYQSFINKTINLKAGVRYVPIVSFYGINCDYDRYPLLKNSKITAFVKGTNKICGDTTVDSWPGEFILNIRPFNEVDTNGAKVGDSVAIRFNNIPTKFKSNSVDKDLEVNNNKPRKFVSLEAEKKIDSSSNLFCYIEGQVLFLPYRQDRSGIVFDTYAPNGAWCGSITTNSQGCFKLKCWGDNYITQDFYEGYRLGDTISIVTRNDIHPNRIFSANVLEWKRDISYFNVYVFFSDSVGLVNIDEPERNKYKDIIIFPNPSNATFNVLSKSNTFIVEMYNILGNRIFKDVSKNNLYTLNININSGIYFLKVVTDNGIIVKKITRLK